MNVATISQFRKNTKKYFDQVSSDQDIVILTRSNGASVAMISMDMFNRLDATDYLNSSSANRRHLLESLEQARAGKFIPKTIDELESNS
ncbi:MAG: type II toxin-antitoxin system Phd/YefM family antitoxin [Candidatus Saccharimonadales bacterium]